MDQEAEQRRRESSLIVCFILLSCGALFVLLFVLIGPLAIVMTGVLVSMGLFAMLHWFLWGHSFTRATAADREGEQLEAAPEVPAAEDDPYRGRY